MTEKGTMLIRAIRVKGHLGTEPTIDLVTTDPDKVDDELREKHPGVLADVNQRCEQCGDVIRRVEYLCLDPDDLEWFWTDDYRYW